MTRLIAAKGFLAFFVPGLNMKQIVFILLANFLLVNGRKLSNWADDKEDTVDLDEIKRTPQVCFIAFCFSIAANKCFK